MIDNSPCSIGSKQWKLNYGTCEWDYIASYPNEFITNLEDKKRKRISIKAIQGWLNFSHTIYNSPSIASICFTNCSKLVIFWFECFTWNSASSTRVLENAETRRDENCFSSSFPSKDNLSNVSAATYNIAAIMYRSCVIVILTRCRVSHAIMSLFFTRAASKSRFFRSKCSILFCRLISVG